MDALKASLERVRAGEGFERDGDDADGDGDDAGLEGLTRDELYERAQKEDVAGRSSMSRKELIAALSE
jgi:hypothetical protein